MKEHSYKLILSPCSLFSLSAAMLAQSFSAAGLLSVATAVAALLGEVLQCTPGAQSQVGCQMVALLSVAGISVSSLSDNLFVLHVHCEDNKQKVVGLIQHFSNHL